MVGVAHHMVEELCGRGNVDLIETTSQDEEDSNSLIDSHQAISSTTITVGDEDGVSGPALHKEGFLVPLQVVEFVAGKNEENLKSMKISLSLSSIQLGLVCTTSKAEQFHFIEISGEKEKIQQAKKILEMLVNHFMHDFPGEDAQLKRINSVISVASAIESNAEQLPKEPVKVVKGNATPNAAVKDKSVEERHKLYTRQIEQTDLENYLKRTMLKVPASLTLQYNGKQFGLVNKFATE
uniref:Uncharacterized protein n=1 Tax=Ditylenchus dipsaci TaxID=166011 RepID=A0A915DSG3_9BILA